jgi:hypothetical protein
MKPAEFILSFLLVGALVFVVSSIVSYLYSLIAHGVGEVDWGSAVRLGIIFGIVIPSLRLMELRKKK